MPDNYPWSHPVTAPRLPPGMFEDGEPSVAEDSRQPIHTRHWQPPGKVFSMDNNHCDHCYEKGYSDGQSNREADYVFALQDIALIPDEVPTTPYEFALWLNENWPYILRPAVAEL